MNELAAAGIAVAIAAAVTAIAAIIATAGQNQDQEDDPSAVVVAAVVAAADTGAATTIITAKQQQQNNNPTIVSGTSHRESPLSNYIFWQAFVSPPDTIRYYDSFSSVPIIFGKISRKLSDCFEKTKKYLTS